MCQLAFVALGTSVPGLRVSVLLSIIVIFTELMEWNRRKSGQNFNSSSPSPVLLGTVFYNRTMEVISCGLVTEIPICSSLLCLAGALENTLLVISAS